MARYWTTVSNVYTQGHSSRSPKTLSGNIDYWGKLSSQLELRSDPVRKAKVVYNASGSDLCAAVIPKDLIVDSTLYYHFTETEQESHYLASIFNAPSLDQYFKDAYRSSDREHSHLSPVENLPIPEYDPRKPEHASLASLSEQAHKQVGNIKPELNGFQNPKQREIVREHPDIKPILALIDTEVAKIIPSDYLS